MKSNLETLLSCKYKQVLYSDKYFNADWQFEMFKKGQDNGLDTWKVLISKYFSLFLVT